MIDKSQIVRSLQQLVDLPLSIARNAGNMKNFQFGTISLHPSGEGTVGQYALHVQCPWRIVCCDGIITGSTDLYEQPDVDTEIDLKNPRDGTLQAKRLGDLLRSYDADTRSWVNSSGQLVVQEVLADDFGGFELRLTGDFRLQIIPCGSSGEDWRFFVPGSEASHLVIEGGQAIP